MSAIIHKSLKAVGALVSPSGITNHLKEWCQILNMVFHLSLAATWTRWYACRRLILV